MIEETAAGRGEGRELRAWRRRRVCSWSVGEEGSREWAARRQRRARRYFPAWEGQYIRSAEMVVWNQEEVMCSVSASRMEKRGSTHFF